MEGLGRENGGEGLGWRIGEGVRADKVGGGGRGEEEARERGKVEWRSNIKGMGRRGGEEVKGDET